MMEKAAIHTRLFGPPNEHTLPLQGNNKDMHT